MSRPSTHPFADRIYDMMSPVAVEDEKYGWPMLIYVQAATIPFHDIDDLTRDRDGLSGWGVVMHPDLCPPGWLDWLGQFNGKVIPSTFTEGQKRIRIKETGGFDRGTLKGVIGAAKEQMYSVTDTPTVVVRERYDPDNPGVDSPWHLTVITYIDEAPDTPEEDTVGGVTRLYSPVIRKALMDQKPIGIVLHSYLVSGVDYQVAIDSGRTYDESGILFPTYQDRTNGEEEGN